MKIYVVTGANNGIGLETTRHLVEHGAKVIMITRTIEKGEGAINEIKRTHPDAELDLYACDLSLMGNIRTTAESVAKKYELIHGLINNAGTWRSDFALTKEGIETVFATNHLSYVMMTHMLYPLLRKADHARIINVASNAHSYGKINLADPGYSKNYHGLKSNGQSKLANLYFTFELNKLKPDAHISVYAVSPGLVKTDIGLKHTSWLHNLAWKFRRRKGQSAVEGSRTSVFCAIDPLIGDHSGKYWENSAPKEVFKSALDPELGLKLWELSNRMCGIDDFFRDPLPPERGTG